jgi:phage protein U
MAMMCLGDFVFELASAPYQSVQRQADWRHPSNERVGLRPARQFVGPGEESVTLAGVLFPGLSGGQMALDRLREMADSGYSFVLIDGNGWLWGCYVIESIEQTGTLFFEDGTPRKIDFSLKLARTDDDDVVEGGEDAAVDDNEEMGL